MINKIDTNSNIVYNSSTKKDNTDRLLNVIKKYLPDNIKYFDDNIITSSSPSFIISEFIREKVLDLTNEEVPYAVTCLVEEIEEEPEKDFEEDDDELDAESFMKMQCENCKHYCPYCGKCSLGE